MNFEYRKDVPSWSSYLTWWPAYDHAFKRPALLWIDGEVSLPFARYFHQAHSLMIEDVDEVPEEDIAELLGHFSELKELWMPYVPITGECLSALPIGADMESIELGGQHLTREGLMQVTRLKHLGRLGLSHSNITDDDLAALNGFRLDELDIGYCRISSEAGKHISAINGLSSLSVWNTQFGDSGLEAIANPSNYTELELQATPTTDHAIPTLNRFINCKVLRLDETLVTNSGFKALGPLPALGYLNIGDTKVRLDAEAFHLQFPKLAVLYITDDQASAKELKRLKELNPGLKVTGISKALKREMWW